jgi:hypothetical protein
MVERTLFLIKERLSPDLGWESVLVCLPVSAMVWNYLTLQKLKV